MKSKKFFLIIFVFFFALFCYFFVGKTKPSSKIEWGVVFSQKHAQLLGLSWKDAYLALLDDLKAKNLKILVHWDFLEPSPGTFHFEDLDWQIKEAEKRGAKIVLVLGLKVGRWPECHWPSFLDCEKLGPKCESELFNYLKTLVLRYRHSKAIFAWQVENEPFFPFGVCPKIKEDFVKREIALVKSLDQRPVIFGDSGEFSFWMRAASLSDIVAVTLHRKVYFKEIKQYLTYPFPPIFYWRKAKLVEKFFGKKVIVGELQAEPWCKNLIYHCSLEEQEKTMNEEQLKKNIDFVKNTGLDTVYFWGSEWWYWLKEKVGKKEVWEEAKKIFTD